jgi:hypothetical protein
MEIKRHSLSGTDKPPDAIPDSGPLPYVPFNSGAARENSTTAPGVIAIDTKPVRTPPGSMRGDAMNGTNAAGTLTDIGPGLPGHGRVFTDTFSGTDNLSRPDGFSMHDSRRTTADPDYDFYGTMSEEVMHRYLSKSILMEALCNPKHDYTTQTGPSNGSANPLDNEYEENMQMLIDLKPAYVSGIGGQSYQGTHGNNELQELFNNMRRTIDRLRITIPHIICEAYITEEVASWWTAHPNPTPIPFYVFYDLGIDRIYRGGDLISGTYRPHDPSVPVETVLIVYPPVWDRTTLHPFLTFDANWMHFDPPSTIDQNADVSQIETQLFYYYLATKYIDAGIESIAFSDYFVVARDDLGYRKTWLLFQAIRRYAARYARRGLVLLNAHDDGLKNYYYDLPSRVPIPFWERRMLFDFCSWGIGFTRPVFPPCTPEYQPQTLTTKYGPIYRSPGGLNPQGWICKHSPYVIHLDHGNGINTTDRDEGCEYARIIPGFLDSTPWMQDHHRDCEDDWEQCGYGWDNMSWFASQGDIDNPTVKPFHRDRIYTYLYYKIKCFDPYGHFMFSGREFIRKKSSAEPTVYRANMLRASTLTPEVYMQQDTIKKCWDNLFAGGFGWVYYNFTTGNVMNAITNVGSSLVFVGAGKMYYIGTDGYIHGYIKVSGNYNDGTWLTVSPSYAAHTRIDLQQKAKSNLVASPDGKRLLYIGVDGYIYGFDMSDDVWRYDYFIFMRHEMATQKLKADSCLIYPQADRIYYIAYQEYDGQRHIHGFQKSSGSWQTVSPSYSAQDNFRQSVHDAQEEAAGALTYDSNLSQHRLYYRGGNGYLYYFEVINIIVYRYINCPGNALLTLQDLTIVGDLAIHGNIIYFVGAWRLDPRQLWIYTLTDSRVGRSPWGSISPTWTAVGRGQPISTQLTSDRWGHIAVSPDGKTIAYFHFAVDGYTPKLYICYYRDLGSNNYEFKRIAQSVVSGNEPDYGKLYFTTNNDLYFASLASGKKVHHFKFQEDYCANPSIDAIEF